MDNTLNQNTTNNLTNQITGLLQKYPVILQLCRFAAIGLLNTGLSFIVANLVSKYFGVTQGNALGLSSGVGFVFATLQSYYWNKYWAFGQSEVSLVKNFFRLVWVGLTGVFALGLIFLGSKATAPYFYYLLLLIIFLVFEVALWVGFKLSTVATSTKNYFLPFIIVSLIGFGINYIVAAGFSSAVHLIANADLNKNLALVVATAVSLVWNFIGYKLIVFKK